MSDIKTCINQRLVLINLMINLVLISLSQAWLDWVKPGLTQTGALSVFGLGYQDFYFILLFVHRYLFSFECNMRVWPSLGFVCVLLCYVRIRLRCCGDSTQCPGLEPWGLALDLMFRDWTTTPLAHHGSSILCVSQSNNRGKGGELEEFIRSGIVMSL